MNSRIEKYINSKTPISITCRVHGTFKIKPDAVISVTECKYCVEELRKHNKRTLNWKNILSKSLEVHGDLYDYSRVKYINANSKMEIICKTHGVFLQNPYNHSVGQGCPLCGSEKIEANKKYNTSIFLAKAKEIHGDTYDYSNTSYIDSSTKVKIGCKTHGEFEQIPVSHLQGRGCNKCAGKLRTGSDKDRGKNFIEKAKEIHNNKYNYSKVKYVNAKTPVTIICKEHGEYEQKPYHHLQGSGCQACGTQKSEQFKKDDNNSILDKFKLIHGYKYDYSLVDYKGSYIKVSIKCSTHGIFTQRPMNHINGQGCPQCTDNISKGETEIADFLEPYTKVITSDRDVLEGSELDILLPEYKTAIEFNGLYWHSDKFKAPNYHINKTRKCNEKGIRLIHIFEDEWRDNKELIKSRLLSIISKETEKIYARNCEVKEVPTLIAMKFLDNNHLQGKVGAKIKLGLYYNGKLISLMTFGGRRLSMKGKAIEGEYELLRFCTEQKFLVIGGASKLLKYFERNYNPIEIISYADLRWSEGKVYEKLNFELVHESKPNYFYTKGSIREGRFNFRKDVLVKNGYDREKTERQIMDALGYYRVYDCGTKKYILKFNV